MAMRTMKYNLRSTPSRMDNINHFRPVETPLELPYLLDMIFEYLPMKDWKNCRLVCKQWRGSSHSKLSKFKLNIKDRNRLRLLVNPASSRKLWNEDTTPSMLQNFELPSDVPFHNEGLFVLFFRRYGAYIKSLTITNNGWTIDDLQNILFYQAPQLEELKIIGNVPTDSDRRLTDGLVSEIHLGKLKRLIFHLTNAQEKTMSIPTQYLGYSESMINPWTRRLISDLLSVTPNLETVGCSNKRDMISNPAFCIEVAKRVNRQPADISLSFVRVNQFLTHKLFSRHHENTRNLINMDLYLRLNNRGMEKLQEKNYPLEYLDLHVRFYDKESLIVLLKSLGKTLKHLRLRMDRILVIDFSCNFLEKLQTIHLEEYGGNLIFLGDLPSLKRIHIERIDCRRFIRKEKVPSYIHSKVKYLSIDSIRSPNTQGQLLKKLGVMFPNIKSLKLNPVKDSDIHQIVDSMPNLEHLELNAESLTNLGLSGFDETDTEKILLAGYELTKYKLYETMRRLPYIGDLKNLQTLTLSGDLTRLTPAYACARPISNMHSLWILNGICNLTSLRGLKLDGAVLSSLELKQLVKKMNLVRLELHKCKYDAPMENWVKRKTFGKPFEFIIFSGEPSTPSLLQPLLFPAGL